MSDGCLGNDTMVDLVEGRADPASLARIEAHASRCTACRAVLSSLARGTAAPSDPALDETATEAATATSGELAVGTEIGRYLVKRMLGAGGMGLVYAAHDPELDRTVAVKLLRPDVGGVEARQRMQERLRREAQAMAQLAHPNVCAVYDVGTFGDRIFVAMEYIDGESLAHWLEAKPRTQREILDAFIAAGRGLAAAHAEGLVHRDFKPENVVIGDDGRVRVLDFGLARETGDAPMRTPLPLVIAHAVAESQRPVDLTRTGMVVGTPYYMAPEQYRGEEADPRTDQFSFCVALYAAIYAQRPFAGETFDALCAAVLTGAVTPPPKGHRVPPRIRDAIAAGLSHDRDARFPSMTALLDALAPVAPRSRRGWMAVAGVVAAGGAVATVLALRTPPAEVPAVCTELDRRLEVEWSDARKAAMAAALRAIAPGIADATYARVIALGDAFATSVRQARDHACAQSLPIATARVACLELRVGALGELTEVLAQPRTSIAMNAVEVAQSLEPVASCATLDPGEPITTPAQIQRRRQLAAIRAKLAAIRVKVAAGDLVPARAAAVALADEADRAADPWLAAEVHALAGSLADSTDSKETKAAKVRLARARELATTAGHHVVIARLLVEQLRVLARESARSRSMRESRLRTLATLRVETANALDAAQQPPELASAAFLHYGEIETAAHAYEAAEEDFQRAIAMFPLDDPRTLPARVALGAMFVQRGRPELAVPVLRRVHELELATRVTDHPTIASARVALAEAELGRGEVAAAIVGFTDARAIYERGAGPNHRELAPVLARLAELTADDDPAAASALLERAVGIDDVHEIVDAGAGARQLAFAEAARPTALDKAMLALRPKGFGKSMAFGRRNLLQHQIDIDQAYRATRGPAMAPPDQRQMASRMVNARTQLTSTLWPRRPQMPLPPPPSGTAPVKPWPDLRPFSLDNRWREQWLLGEVELWFGEPAKAVPLLEAALSTMAGQSDAAIAAVEAALGRALIDGKHAARGRALIEGAAPRLANDPWMTQEWARLAPVMASHAIALPD